MRERVLRSVLLVDDESMGPVVARIVDRDDGGFAGWLLMVDDHDHDRMPSGFVDGWLRPATGGLELAVRLEASTGGRVFFSSRQVEPQG
jgi:hypothetical protein